MKKFLQAPLLNIARNQNVPKTGSTISFERKDIFANNVKFLEDPATQRKLILIGTTNSSSLLANRTQKILEIANPDSVLVESNESWFQTIVKLGGKNIKSNKELQDLDFDDNWSAGSIPNNPRNLIFKSKYYAWLALSRNFFPLIDEEANTFKPGLEAFRVANWAAENKKEIYFSGKMFNPITIEAMINEKRMHLFSTMFKIVFGFKTPIWKAEYTSFTQESSLYGVKSFSENLDEERVNWLIKMYKTIIPHQAKILIDDEDERLFNLIYSKMTGKVNIALVNAWHLPGIEHHWKHATGTDVIGQFINPIGDFDIDGARQKSEINEFLRRNKSKKSKSEPAVTSDDLVHYNKQNMEAERERHVFFQGWDDPELEHGLYNDENKGVKNLPYKQGHH